MLESLPVPEEKLLKCAVSEILGLHSIDIPELGVEVEA
jgi:hypothetical protein